jgi:acyl-CoA reductase-like NAD-dependent aldehyde dehydrogenase
MSPLPTALEQAVARVAGSAARTAQIPAYRRADALLKVSEGIAREKEAFAKLICEEVDKPLASARVEAERAIFTFRLASEEAKRWGGEWLPLDFDAANEGRLAVVRRVPRGPCLFITPFNFPLNLVAHKVAPAIAVGAPFVLKPAPHCPKTAQKLGELLAASGWPAEAFAILPCSNEEAELMVRDDRFSVLSFTGSGPVGWKLKSICGKKHCVLELGGNAGVVVAPDADLPWAAARVAAGAYGYSGQTCISVQRVFAHEKIYDKFRDLLLKNVAELKAGDPKDEKVTVGPLIDAKAADRVEAWIREAVEKGGKTLVGGPRKERLIPATLVEDVPESCKLSYEEAFGPVATLEKVATVEAGLEKLAKSRYGLQAGLFTRDVSLALRAWNTVPVGALIVNDIPTFRSDAMPYGGTKDSGIGREGVRYAMEEFTEPRALVLKA